MKCPKCSGAGYVYDCFVGYAKDCSVCHGKGEVQTNEEWLRQCTTEQLAEWIVDITQYCFECGINTQNCQRCPFGKCIDKGCAMEWLKEKHTDDNP